MITSPSRIIIQSLILCSICSFIISLKIVDFKQATHLADRITNNSLLEQATLPKSRSRLDCAIRCLSHLACKTYMYKLATKVCRLHSKSISQLNDDSYTFTYSPGFKAFGVDLDDCLTFQPCKNGSTCTDHDHGYSCACATGFIGLRCDVDEDDCLSTPCMNSGTCHDRVGGFSCSCKAGFTGYTCETPQPISCRENSTTCACPETLNDWEIFEGHCYKYFDGKNQTNFQGAVDACATFGANVTSVNTIEEKLFLDKNWGRMWMDLQFPWTHWGDGTLVGWTDWSLTDLRQSGENCSNFGSQAFWHPRPCSMKLPYTCEALAVPVNG